MSDALKRLSNLAETHAALELLVDNRENEIHTLKRDRDHIAEQQIPELMEELGIAEFKTTSGLTITVGDKVRCGVLKNAKGLAWLREHGHGGLVKTAVTVPFARGGEDAAVQLVDRLEGEGLKATAESHVHNQTLGSAVDAMLKDGEDVPLELLGAYLQRRAKVT